MKESADNRSETMSARYGGASQISTPRLTPLKFLDRNRNQLLNQDDITTLESKIKELENQITNTKKKGEEKKQQIEDKKNTTITEEGLKQLAQENMLL